MIWIGLIAFGIFGLCTVGGYAGWIAITIGAIGLVWKYVNQEKSGNQEPSSDAEADMKTIEIPDDAHDAVEAFARLVGRIYAILDQAYTRDKYFYQACIKLRFGDDDISSHAEFSLDFDWNMEGFFASHGYRLGDGFSVDGDSVCYMSDQVQNLYSWLDATGVEKERIGLVLIDRIITTFMSNCPSAYVEHKSYQERDFFVLFKFK